MNFIIKLEIVREGEKCTILNFTPHIHPHPEFFRGMMFTISPKKTLDEGYQILAMNGYEGLLLEVREVGGC